MAEVKRFLRDLANHHHLVKHWSSPRVLAVAEYMLNDDPEMPSSITPYELTYGGQDADLQRIINEADPKSVDVQPGHKYLVSLLADIQAVREVYGKHRADLLRARTEPTRLLSISYAVFCLKKKKKKKQQQNPIHSAL